MSAQKSPASKSERPLAEKPVTPTARTRRHTLRSSTVGALPILNDILRRMRLAEFLRAALPPEDRRMKLSPVKALLVLLRNLLVSREPIYGIGEWAARHAADALGLSSAGDRAAQRRLRGTGPGPAVRRRRARRWSWPWPRTWSGSSAFPWTNCTTIRPRSTFCGAYTRADGQQRAFWAAPPWPSPSATTRTIAPT